LTVRHKAYMKREVILRGKFRRESLKNPMPGKTPSFKGNFSSTLKT